MAGVFATFVTGEVALTGGTARTVLQIANAANHRAKVLSFSVGFDGTSGTAEPVLVEVLRQSTAGTMSSLTGLKINSDDGEAIQTTSQHSATGADPTAGDVIFKKEVHPQGGYEKVFPFGQEIPLGGATAAATRLAIKCTAPANVNVVAEFHIEE